MNDPVPGFTLLSDDNGLVISDTTGLLAIGEVAQTALTEFETEFRAAEPVLDDVMGELFVITPRTVLPADVNAPPADDDAKPDFTFAGIFCESGMDSRPSQRTGGPAGPWSGTEPAIDVRITAMIGMSVPSRDDIVHRLKTGQRFRIDRCSRGDIGRMFLHLTRIRNP